MSIQKPDLVDRRTVRLTDEQCRKVEQLVETGRFSNESAAIRAAIDEWKPERN